MALFVFRVMARYNQCLNLGEREGTAFFKENAVPQFCHCEGGMPFRQALSPPYMGQGDRSSTFYNLNWM